jgi:hypothetical protein
MHSEQHWAFTNPRVVQAPICFLGDYVHGHVMFSCGMSFQIFWKVFPQIYHHNRALAHHGMAVQCGQAGGLGMMAPFYSPLVS